MLALIICRSSMALFDVPPARDLRDVGLTDYRLDALNPAPLRTMERTDRLRAAVGVARLRVEAAKVPWVDQAEHNAFTYEVIRTYTRAVGDLLAAQQAYLDATL